MNIKSSKPTTEATDTFDQDIEFLKKHKRTIVLKAHDNQCQVAVVPDFQGRVMTSTSSGSQGTSYGWINYPLIASRELVKHINPFGGEDRIWLGPEAGQYGIFFEDGTEFNLKNWQTPKGIDSVPFDVVSQSDSSVLLSSEMSISNYSGFKFDVKITRKVSILQKEEIEHELNIQLKESIQYVGFKSANKLKNTGMKGWKKSQGLLSIWIIGMFKPSKNTTVIIPYQNTLQLNTEYFGALGSDRIKTIDNTVLFKADANYRSKIGLLPENVLPVIGSFDVDKNILTIVQYSFQNHTDYVNSLWKWQEHPYRGDVVNSYNDGPTEDGSQLGTFFELETSSSVKELIPNETIEHVHKTYHFEGHFEDLNVISKEILGFDLLHLIDIWK